MLAFDVNSGADEALHLSLSLLPSRVLALPATLVRVGSLVGASLAGFEAEMENAFAAAASDAATAALAASRAVDIQAAAAAKPPDPPIKLRLHLHGPLIVLPLPSAPHTAVLLRVGDLVVSSAVVEGPPPSSSLEAEFDSLYGAPPP